MNCPTDNGHVKITHVYVEGSNRTQRGVCEQCGRKFTISSVMYPQEQVGHASALARRLKNGAVSLDLSNLDVQT